MPDQKYRAECSAVQDDGAIVWRARWTGGFPIAKVENCRLETLSGSMRATVTATGDPDTYFSIPAVCRFMGVRVRGYLTSDDNGNIVFRHCYY